MANNGAKCDHPFHVNATAIGTGKDFIVDGISDTMKLDITIAEGTTFSFDILAQSVNRDSWKPFPVIQDSVLSPISIKVTDATYFYTIDLRGIVALRLDLTAVSGTVSIWGRAVG